MPFLEERISLRRTKLVLGESPRKALLTEKKKGNYYENYEEGIEDDPDRKKKREMKRAMKKTIAVDEESIDDL